MTKKFVYLNHAAVAPISMRVRDAVMKFSQEALQEGYTAGPRWVKRIEEIRAKAAKLIHAHRDEVAFVKNTSHGLSLIARGLSFKSGDEIIISDVEFPANVYPWLALEQQGVVVKKIPSRGPELDLEALPQLMTNKTKLVSLSSVQFGTGFRLPLEKVGALCRERGVYFCVDAIQSLGAFNLDVVADHVDFLAADAHKWLLGPEGIGILYVKKELLPKLEPSLLGWNSVQGALNFDHVDYRLRDDAQKFEEGSSNTLSIYALGAAIDLILEVGIERISTQIMSLTDRLIEGLQALSLPIHSSLNAEYRSGILLFSLSESPQNHALEELENHLYSQGIYCSIRHGHLRLSPHFYNTTAEMDQTLKEIQSYLEIGNG